MFKTLKSSEKVASCDFKAHRDKLRKENWEAELQTYKVNTQEHGEVSDRVRTKVGDW